MDNSLNSAPLLAAANPLTFGNRHAVCNAQDLLGNRHVPNRRSVVASIALSTRNRPNLIFWVFFARRSQNGALPGAKAALLKQLKKNPFSQFDGRKCSL